MPYFEPSSYIKDESSDPVYKTSNKNFLMYSRVYSILFSFIGISILVTQIIVPLVFFKTKDVISKPVSSTVLGLASGFREFEFSELGSPSNPNSKVDVNIPSFYYLTIPKLDIKDALVETVPEDLNPDDALGHYPGSALPGNEGNTFIYGHSVLPVFYNSENYKTIFSTLPTLEVGDKFSITYNNRKMEYVVESAVNLNPKDVDPLGASRPKYLEEDTVTLMTCTPPGTKIKRLLVNAVRVR